jgi:serine/threonine protein kinase/cytoskeletal protein RodZ
MAGTGRDGDFYIGPYKVVDELGVGGFATVYKAVVEGDLGFEREVALKVLHAHITRNKPEVVRMLADEARLLARMKHPNIVGVQWFGQLDHPEGGRVFAMLMEYVDGRSLRSLLEELRWTGQPLPLSVLLDVHVAIARGLAYAHRLADDAGQRLGLVHRDLKPDNVMISAHGQIKLLDFGIAKAKDRLAEQTATDQVRGTVHYMSPEQVRGRKDLDFRSDIFSFGSMLYEAAAGERLISGDSVISALHSVVSFDPTDPLDRIRDLHPPLAEVLRRCLAVDRDDRWPSTDALVAELENLRRTVQTDETTAAFLGERARRRATTDGPVSGTEDTVAVPSQPDAPASSAPFTRTEAVPTPAQVRAAPEPPAAAPPPPEEPGPTRAYPAKRPSRGPLGIVLAVLLVAGGIAVGVMLGQRGTGESIEAAAGAVAAVEPHAAGAAEADPGGQSEPTPEAEDPAEAELPAAGAESGAAEAESGAAGAESGAAEAESGAAEAVSGAAEAVSGAAEGEPVVAEPAAPAATSTPAPVAARPAPTPTPKPTAPTPAPEPAAADGPPGRLRVTADHAFELTVAGKRHSQLDARRGIALPPGDHAIVLRCLDCPDGVAPRLSRTVTVPSGDTLVQKLKFPEDP